MTKKLYLIDGSGFIFRAYHALPPLTSPTGTPVGAVYGFVNMLLRLMEGNQCDYAAVIFDAGRTTFRNRIYPEYKAHRPPAPDDLIPQFALVRDATRAMNLPAIEMDDFEADDIIATYAAQATAQGMETIIVSSDKDLMQLIGGGVSMYDAMKQKTIGAAEVMEKFGVSPDKVLDVLSLMGDSSDNVPGVPSIGPKTAAELINQYGDLDTLLARAGEIKQPKRREAILTHIDQAKLSRELITLKSDVPLPIPITDLTLKGPEGDVLAAFVQQHGFKSLATRIQNKFNIPAHIMAETAATAKPPATAPSMAANIPAPAPVEKHYELVRDEASLAKWIAKAKQKGIVAFDTETTSLNALTADLVGFSLCVVPGEACYVPLAHVEGKAAPAQGGLFDEATTTVRLVDGQIPMARALELLRPLLADASVMKIGHNIKYDLLVMHCRNAPITPITDSMLLSFVLHAGEHGHGMDELAERYLQYKPISFDDVTGTGKARITFDHVALDKACEYAAEDADITLRLYEFFKAQLFEQKMTTLYETIERPLIPVIARMEIFGIKVDVSQLHALSGDFSTRMGEFEREIYALAGHEFNVGSPKQLGEILFDEMKLEGGKKSKTGAYATGSDVLEELSEQGHAIAGKVLDWRRVAKLKSTYSDTLPEQINPRDGRVHTSYGLTGAATGRLSSSDPNLQNIPIRSAEGKKIREAFVAAPGCQLISADYSQIELRLLAHMADIQTLKEAFAHGDDIHAITASQMFGVPVTDVNADLRRSAKTINFGIIYGISAHGLAARLGIGRSEAGAYIERYFAQYPGIRDYMETSKAFARAHGYVTTLYGRRCHLPGINGKGPMRAFSERAAINAPLQGTAADIIKKAMIAIDAKIGAIPGAKMLLQVHDELVFETPAEQAAATEMLAKTCMESAAQLSVPLVVESGIGTHWGEIH